jgi:hypothetical protein
LDFNKLQNTREEFESLREYYWANLEEKCANCAAVNSDFHLHHIVPLSLSGTNYITNICVLCGNCHSRLHQLGVLKNHSKLTIKGKEFAKSNGKWSTGKIVYGYQKGKTKGSIEINPAESQIVSWIYHLRFESNLSTTQILQILIAMSIPTKLNGSWSYSRLSNILDTDVYFGSEHYGVKFPPILDEKMKNKRDIFKQRFYDYDKNRYNFLSKTELIFGKGIRFSKDSKNPKLVNSPGKKRKPKSEQVSPKKRGRPKKSELA